MKCAEPYVPSAGEFMPAELYCELEQGHDGRHRGEVEVTEHSVTRIARRSWEGPPLIDCVFCAKIRKGGDEHGEVFPTHDPGTVRFEPLDPVTPGHMLFVPRRHEHKPYNIGKAAQAAAWWNTDDNGAYNIITSYGVAATQSVPHPHVHFVPRFANDGLPLPWTKFSKVTGRALPSNA